MRSSLDDVTYDARYALRTLRRSPGFAIVAVLSLATAIGAATATFSVIDALVLRTLPVHRPSELVMLKWVGSDYVSYSADSSDFAQYRDLGQVFSGVVGVEFVDRSNISLGRNDDASIAAPTHVALVSTNYFSVLGVGTRLGTTFGNTDDSANRAVVVVSDAYWLGRLGGAPDVVDRPLRLNGIPYTIIGVAPRGFNGDWVGRPADIWVPLAMHAQVIPEARSRFDIRIIARLRPGVPRPTAEAATQVVYERVKAGWRASGLYPPALQRTWARRVSLQSASTGFSPQRAMYARPLAILMGITVLLLVASCANIAGLLIARGAARHQEISIRTALGATRARLARQSMTESVCLAVVGGALGAIVAWMGTTALSAFVASGPPPFLGSEDSPSGLAMTLDLRVDWRVIAFSFATCLFASVLFGLVSALRSSRVTLASSLAVRGANAEGARLPLAKGLVAAQVALSLLMVVGAGLLALTLRNLGSQRLGFDRTHLLLVWTDPSQVALRDGRLTSVWHSVRDRIAELPGVRAAAVTDMGLLNGRDAATGSEFYAAPGTLPRAGQHLVNTKVTPGFFETAGIPLRRGRDFTRFDTDSSPPVIILNETMARFYFGTDDPIGKRLDFTRPHTFGPYTIVGVVADTKNGIREARAGAIYYPSGQTFRGTQAMVIVVRAVGEPRLLAQSVRSALRAVNPDLPILQINTVEEELQAVLARERLMATLGGFFGVVATLLACLGVYGVLSYLTSRRSREIGIRMALGATRLGVATQVLRESLALASVGLVIGVIAALGFTRFLSSQLYGVRPTNLPTIIGASLLVLGTAGLAAFLPARRAAAVDPLVALRSE